MRGPAQTSPRWRTWRQVIPSGLVLLVIALGCSSSKDGELRVMSELPGRTGYDKETGLEVQAATFTNLYSASAADLAEKILGAGITIKDSTAVFTGDVRAAGIFSFSDEDDVIGFSEGIVLSSGRVRDLQGPNASGRTTFNYALPGDPDLTALVGAWTYDAAVLSFTFVPDADRVFLNYVFGSEEYNEYVNSPFNDVFAFFVNGVNYAVVNDQPISVNRIHDGNLSPAPGVAGIATGSNAEFFRNNAPGSNSENLNLKTELDGLTVVLTLEAPVARDAENTIKLAIADTADHILDAAVFIEAGSFITTRQVPGISVEKLANPTSVSAPGDITYAYMLTNTGNVALTIVTVVDDNATADNNSDDFEPSYVSGDTNGNNKLDLNETWVYTYTTRVSQTHIDVGADIVNIVTATTAEAASDSATATVAVTQNANIDIEKDSNGSDGSTIPVGQPVTWRYVVTNTGNVTLHDIAVTDDKVDSSAIHCGEGSNVVATLAPDESATCTASGTAVAGLYENVGTATSTFNGVTVQGTDPSSYFGQISGCTPGFWQGGTGSQLWDVANDPDWQGVYAQPYTHATKFFGNTRPYTSPFKRGRVPTGDIPNAATMFELVSTGGSSNDAQKAARSVVAAYLNASYEQEGPEAYPLTRSEIASKWETAASIKDEAARNAAFASLHDELDAYNNTFDCRR
jgi:hypothetical protein